MKVRVYYLQAEYAPGRHSIQALWIERLEAARPEDFPDTAINVPYSVIEFDDLFNPELAKFIVHNARSDSQHAHLPDRYYVNNLGQIVNADTGVAVAIVANPNKADWVASVLAGATDVQIDTWFTNNVTTLAQARTVMAMMAKLIARLARQAGLE